MSERRRLFAEELPAAGGELLLSEETSRHARVLRLQEGDALRLFDGAGGEADAVLTALGRRLGCRAEAREELPDDGAGVVLVLALPRAGKLDDILRAVTELGVRAIHLADAERSVSEIHGAKLRKKQERWQAVVREAARQCERPRVPEVVAPEALLEVARRAGADVGKVVLAARGERPLPATLPPTAWVCVGPEGGFSDAELDGLEGLGYQPARFGEHVLRVETAAVAGVALVMDRLGRALPATTSHTQGA